MREISSKDNKIYKVCEQLLVRKYRDRLGKYLIEGENLMEEAVKNGAEIETVLIRPDYDKDLGGLAEKTFVLDGRLFDHIAQTETSQGILAIVSKPEVSKDAFLSEQSRKNFIVLDRLQDPGNIGTILRTADAAGYGLAVIMKGTVDIFSPKVVRAATGSLFRMPVVFMDSISELVDFSRAAGRKLVATCLDAQSYYFDEDLSENIALIIGNEGNGISKELMESSDIRIKIPMHGNIESLNASVAAGILMYESIRGMQTNHKSNMEG